MKIGSPLEPNLPMAGGVGPAGSSPGGVQSPDRRAGGLAARAAESQAPGAQVALSATASQMLRGVTDTSADFDIAKVERITQAIAQGRFSINAEAIADKLLANAQEVLSRTRN